MCWLAGGVLAVFRGPCTEASLELPPRNYRGLEQLLTSLRQKSTWPTWLTGLPCMLSKCCPEWMGMLGW
uniref:Uncharacterized protein n=1 Tax=Anguilla anguilla TaxID=7936 RepID=A0A0E9V6D9_ANGAN